MIISRNPTPEKIKEIINLSKDLAAKWIYDPSSNDYWYWPSDAAFHANVAKSLNISKYDKGIATND